MLPGAPPPFLQTLGGGKLFQLSFNPNLTETWYDNFNLTSTNKQQNLRTTLGAGMTLLINGPTTKGIISSNAGLTHDTEGSQGWQLFPTISAAVTQTLSPRLSLTATDSFNRNDQPNQGDAFGLRTQRQTFSTNTFSLSANYLMDRVATQAFYTNTMFLSGGTNGIDTGSNTVGASASTQIGLYNTAQVGVSHSWSDTSGTSSGTNSGQTTSDTIYGSLSRQTGQYSSVGISSSYSHQTAPQSSNDSDIWSVSLFSAYGLPSGLSFSGSLGYSLLSPSNQSSTSAITSNSTVSYNFARASISLGLFSGFRQTALEGQNFGIVQTTGVTGSFFYTFTPFITGNTQATYATNSSTGVSNNDSTPNSNSFTANAGLSWQMLRWLSGSLQYMFTQYGSGGSSVTGTGSISANQVSLSFVASF
jgi:hypothetical protein